MQRDEAHEWGNRGGGGGGEEETSVAAISIFFFHQGSHLAIGKITDRMRDIFFVLMCACLIMDNT